MQGILSRAQLIVIVGASLLATRWAANYSSTASMPVVAQLRPAEAYALIQAGRVLVLDVREKEAYDKDHLPGAISVPIGELDARIGEFEADKADEIIIYCNDGSKRGPNATDKMNKAGYPGAKNLDGGIEGWRAANYKTTNVR